MNRQILVLLIAALGLVAVIGLAGYSIYRMPSRINPPKPIAASFEQSGTGGKLGLDTLKTVMIAVHIGKDGKVIADSIVTSSGDSIVDADALERGLRLEFDPATKGGRTVDQWVTIPLKYHPEGDTLGCRRLREKK